MSSSPEKHSSAGDSPTDDQLSARWYWLTFALLYGLHLALMAYAVPLSTVFGDLPYGNPDYQTHFGQTTTLIRGVEQFGKLWVFDFNVLAGCPVGLIFDVDNKAHFLFTYGLHQLGVPISVGFNLFGAITVLIAPFSLWLATRLFHMGRRGQLFALGLGILVWHFDSSARMCWAGGMISFATVSHLSLLIWALFYRMLEARKTRYLWPLLLLLPLALHTHVWAFGILVVPLIGLYIRAFKTLDRADHIRVWGLALFALAANLHWLIPALRYFDLVARSGVVGQTNPLHIISEYFEVLVNPLKTGFVMPHTFYRHIALVAAVLGLIAWKRQRDPRFFYAMLTFGWLFFLSFFAALIPGIREMEPYRFVLPFELIGVMIGAVWLAGALRIKRIRALPPFAKGLLLLALVVILPRIAPPVLYFMPEVQPSAYFPPMIVRQDQKIEDVSGPRQFWLKKPALPVASIWRMKATSLTSVALAQYLKVECREPGRILVQNWVIGEMLYWATGKPIIGGFPDRRLVHEAANLFHRPKDRRYWGSELADYLVRYNIRYLVVTEPVPPLEKRRDLLEPKMLIGGHRVYRVRHRGNYFMQGHGKVEASLNKLTVSDASPSAGTQSVVLRFHHIRGLQCKPNCQVVKHTIPDDSVGFIEVRGKPTLPKNFVVEHVY
jgi:hypothetical protein